MKAQDSTLFNVGLSRIRRKIDEKKDTSVISYRYPYFLVVCSVIFIGTSFAAPE